MIGYLFAIIAGISMSIQGVFNTRTSEKIGSWNTNVLVQGIGFILSLLIVFIIKSKGLSQIKEVNKLYLTGGILAVVITFTVMEGIKRIGITTAISVILVAQLASAALIHCCGLFHTESLKFGTYKILGLIAMIIGILLFQYKS